MKTATELAQQIADQELEACCEWIANGHSKQGVVLSNRIRAARRPKPIPVTERLPGPGDCTPQGWCWVLYRGFSTWTLEPPLGRDGQPTGWTHWLPAHALPVPGEGEA